MGLLTIAFIVLKLCNMIDWSWWWVISPMLISIGLAFLILGTTGIYYFYKACKEKKEYESRRSKMDAEINDLRKRANEIHDSISQGKAESRWQRRMNEMQNRQEANK